MDEPTPIELLAWVAELFEHTGAEDPSDAEIARQLRAVVQVGGGAMTMPEDRFAILVVALQVADRDPDLFFVDAPGTTFGPERRSYPARVLRMLGVTDPPDERGRALTSLVIDDLRSRKGPHDGD